MSWYMFRDAPSFQPRGIKVDGFNYLQRPNLNLSWGMNQKQTPKQLQSVNNLPSQPLKNEVIEQGNNMKVMTETSDQEEELIKLIKNRKAADKDKAASNYFNTRTKSRSRSSQGIQKDYSHTNESKFIKNSEFSKRVRYLENSLLPHCRQDNMDTILDHNLTKEVTLEESRMSKNSQSPNRPESKIRLGDGYNAFNPYTQVKKDLTQKLKEMYEYEDRCKQRFEKNHIKLG